MISGLSKSYPYYRTYLKYPELNIPTTSNCIESLNSKFRDLCYRSRGFRTLKAFSILVRSFLLKILKK